MLSTSLHLKRHLCYGSDWSGLDEFKPINIIIGKNNTGKSHFLDLAKIACATPQEKGHFDIPGVQLLCKGVFDEAALRRTFPRNTSGGDLNGDHWLGHGVLFAGKKVEWTTDHTRTSVFDLKISDPHPSHSSASPQTREARESRLKGAVAGFTTPLTGKTLCTILADRDIAPEGPSDRPLIQPNGTGATNLIRKFLTSSDPNYPRELIQITVLNELREIYSQDATFNEIGILLHDEPNQPSNTFWEIFFGENEKGLIPLSKSGSGLKTVLLILLNLFAVPHLLNKKPNQIVYAFEEIENNLHPAIIRKLFLRLERFTLDNETTIFITTHSSVALDMFAGKENAQIIHISQQKGVSNAITVNTLPSAHALLAELGTKPSDLLQANGIIWVEGPSDRIYINRWIEIFSEGDFEEGRHYQCAYFGGALLARVEFAYHSSNLSLANLLKLNSNIAVISDSDRTSPTARLKAMVAKVKLETDAIPGAFLWITKPKEIEHYIPTSVIDSAFSTSCSRQAEPYEIYFPSSGKTKVPNYLNDVIGKMSPKKTEMALLTVPYMTRENMLGQYDLSEKVSALIETIKKWNE